MSSASPRQSSWRWQSLRTRQAYWMLFSTSGTSSPAHADDPFADRVAHAVHGQSLLGLEAGEDQRLQLGDDPLDALPGGQVGPLDVVDAPEPRGTTRGCFLRCRPAGFPAGRMPARGSSPEKWCCQNICQGGRARLHSGHGVEAARRPADRPRRAGRLPGLQGRFLFIPGEAPRPFVVRLGRWNAQRALCLRHRPHGLGGPGGWIRLGRLRRRVRLFRDHHLRCAAPAGGR